MTKQQLAALSRPELERAYLECVPAQFRESTSVLVPTYSDAYMIARLSPAPKARRRGPRMARHCNDEGVS